MQTNETHNYVMHYRRGANRTLAEQNAAAGAVVAWRARSRVGEDNHRPLTNNCERSCEWCLRGPSSQIDACLALPSRAQHATQH
jgi:hypothetical protein